MSSSRFTSLLVHTTYCCKTQGIVKTGKKVAFRAVETKKTVCAVCFEASLTVYTKAVEKSDVLAIIAETVGEQIVDHLVIH